MDCSQGMCQLNLWSCWQKETCLPSLLRELPLTLVMQAFFKRILNLFRAFICFRWLRFWMSAPTEADLPTARGFHPTGSLLHTATCGWISTSVRKPSCEPPRPRWVFSRCCISTFEVPRLCDLLSELHWRGWHSLSPPRAPAVVPGFPGWCKRRCIFP